MGAFVFSPVATLRTGRRGAVTKILKRWLLSPDHYDFPYPNDEEKQRLADLTGISIKQLNTWFTNSRKR